MWVRVSDVTTGTPARRSLSYRNTNAARDGYNGMLAASISWVDTGYRIALAAELLFAEFATAEEAKTFLDSILQPFYVELP